MCAPCQTLFQTWLLMCAPCQTLYQTWLLMCAPCQTLFQKGSTLRCMQRGIWETSSIRRGHRYLLPRRTPTSTTAATGVRHLGSTAISRLPHTASVWNKTVRILYITAMSETISNLAGAKPPACMIIEPNQTAKNETQQTKAVLICFKLMSWIIVRWYICNILEVISWWSSYTLIVHCTKTIPVLRCYVFVKVNAP